MRLCSIVLLILSVFLLKEVVELNRSEPVPTGSLIKVNELTYRKKIPQRKSNKIFDCSFQFFNGIKTAIQDNVHSILKSLLYPIESMIKILEFCKKVAYKIFYFVAHPQPDHIYIEILDNKMSQVMDFFSQMNSTELSKWFGYVIMDFSIGYYAPLGLGWKIISSARKTVISIKSLKYFDLVNRASSVNLNVLKLMNNKQTASLLNVKYSIEYIDQFKQYLNDVVRYESC